MRTPDPLRAPPPWAWKDRWTTRMLKAGSSKMGAHFLLPPRGFLNSSGALHNVAMSLGVVEIFFILVVVGLVVYVLWRLLIRPRRIRPRR
jgi:hypothetical protein